jgi:hypothetical protein
MKLIETVTLGSAASLIVFNSLPTTFTDLYITCSLRGTESAVTTSVYLTFNGGAQGSVFSQRWLEGNGSSVSSGSYTSAGQVYPFYTSGASSTSNTFGNGAIYIPNYTASASRSITSEGGSENNGTTVRMEIGAGLFASTAAISFITIGVGSGNFVTGSTVSLYGITKGSDGIVTTS